MSDDPIFHIVIKGFDPLCGAPFDGGFSIHFYYWKQGKPLDRGHWCEECARIAARRDVRADEVKVKQ